MTKKHTQSVHPFEGYTPEAKAMPGQKTIRIKIEKGVDASIAEIQSESNAGINFKP